MAKAFLFLCSIFFATAAFSQNIAIDNIRWKVDRLQDTATQEVMNSECSFTTTSDQIKIIWDQKNGMYVSDFSIVSIKGSWVDVSQPGFVEYTVRYEGESGTFWIGNESGKTEVRLNFPKAGKNMMPYHFNIVSIIKI